MASLDIAFTKVGKGIERCEVPNGTLFLSTSPGVGVTGYLRLNGTSRKHMLIKPGKHPRIGDGARSALYSAWREFVGLDDLRSFVG